jgi:hypothetical protein
MVYVHRINFNHFRAIALYVVLLNVYITTSAIDILFSNSSKAFRWKSAVMLLKTKTVYKLRCPPLQLERISPSCQVWFTISLNPTNTFLEMKKRSSCFFLLLQMLHFILKSFLDKNAVFLTLLRSRLALPNRHFNKWLASTVVVVVFVNLFLLYFAFSRSFLSAQKGFFPKVNTIKREEEIYVQSSLCPLESDPTLTLMVFLFFFSFNDQRE